MSAMQVKDALECIIAMWKSISTPASTLREVPEFSEEEAKAKAEKEKAARLESENTDLLLKLMQQSQKPMGKKPPVAKSLASPSPIKVTRLSTDARPLTAEEYRMYGNLVTRYV